MPAEEIIVVRSESDLPAVAQQILALAGGRRIFLFEGEMGSGKTTLIKAVCRALGCEDNIASPTYSIVNEYHSPAGKLYHFDLYRLRDESELHAIGFHEYLDSGNYCFVEWPGIYSGWPEDVVNVRISINEKDRQVAIS